jgi:HK97 family phage major capsid protein
MANAFDAGAATAGTTKPDTIAAAIARIAAAGLRPNALNGADWLSIATQIDTTGQYLFGTGQNTVSPVMWSVPVVLSVAMAAGSYLVMAGRDGAELCIREDATVEASREDRDNWIKNLLTILAEMREALCVFLPQSAFVKGTFATT